MEIKKTLRLSEKKILKRYASETTAKTLTKI